MSRPDAAADVPFLDRARETAPPDSLRRWQWERLAAGLGEVWGSNAFWRGRLQAAGVRDPRDVGSWADFARLPRLTKAELAADQAAHPPFGTNHTHPLDRYVRVFQTSGTTGPPIRWLETEASWTWWARCWAFVFRGAGLGPQDRLFFPFSFGLFVGFWAGLEGARVLGAMAIPGGGQDSADAAPRDAGARRHGARLHAVLRAPPRGGRARPGRRPRRARRPHDGPRGRAGGGHPGRARAAWSRSGERGRTITRA